jgi:uncharacterized protein YjiK
MRMILTLALLALTMACSAQADDAKQGGKKKKGGKKKASTEAMASVAGLTRTGSLAGVAESSGLALAGAPGTFYTHGDHGNRAELYRINWEGKLLDKLPVMGAENQDWEALAHDNQNRLYIADVGNNANNRRDLVIYRFDPKEPQAAPARIQFTYSDQKEFPPTNKAARNFDCESVVWREGTLYLFTRDRGQHRHCRVYALDAQPGQGIAKPIGEYELDGEISGADISPNGRQLALIGREQLFLIDLPATGIIGGKPRTMALKGAGQTEGVVFVDDKTLAITTEQGAIYRLEL